MLRQRPVYDEIQSIWASTLAWFDSHTTQIVIALILAAIIVALLMGIRWFGKKMARKPKEGSSWRAVIGGALAGMRFWFMAIVAAKVVSVYAIAPPEVAGPVNTLFIIAFVLQAALFARELILGAVELRAAEADPTGNLPSAIGLIRVLVSIALALMALILVLGNLGVNVSGLLAGLGIGGIAIGLAAQGIFSDLFAALTILFDKPFRKGDIIRWDTNSGTVEAIGLKSTRIRSLTGEQIIVSNSNLLSKELRNFARVEYRRITQVLGLVYHTPTDKLAVLPEQLRAVVDGIEGCNFLRAGLDVFSPSSVDVQLVYDIHAEDQDELLAHKNDVNIAVLNLFAAEGLAFAYPTQTTYTAAPDGTLVMPYAQSLP